MIINILLTCFSLLCPSRNFDDNSVIDSRGDDKGQTNEYSGRRKDSSKTFCFRCGYVVNIETLFLYTCNETCEMKDSAVCAAMFATEQRGGGEVTTKQKEESQHFQRAYNGP